MHCSSPPPASPWALLRRAQQQRAASPWVEIVRRAPKFSRPAPLSRTPPFPPWRGGGGGGVSCGIGVRYRRPFPPAPGGRGGQEELHGRQTVRGAIRTTKTHRGRPGRGGCLPPCPLRLFRGSEAPTTRNEGLRSGQIAERARPPYISTYRLAGRTASAFLYTARTVVRSERTREAGALVHWSKENTVSLSLITLFKERGREWRKHERAGGKPPRAQLARSTVHTQIPTAFFSGTVYYEDQSHRSVGGTAWHIRPPGFPGLRGYPRIAFPAAV